MSDRRGLERLAALHELETSYEDDRGRRHQASDAGLLGMLQCLGAPVRSEADVGDALVSRELEVWGRPLEPVQVTRERTPPELRLRLPEPESGARFIARIALEEGETESLDGKLSDLPTEGAHEVSGRRFLVKTLRFERPLPRGYHRARVEAVGRTHDSLVLCPPGECWGPGSPAWGVFAPLYALHCARSLGAGDLGDLEALLDWVGTLGARTVATLPLLPAFLDELFDPSPYAPVSRLFWNEFYLDLDRLAETASEGIRERLASRAFTDEADALRGEPLVDYRRQMALKKDVLRDLAAELLAGEGREREAFEAYIENHPRVLDYARFRAATELAGRPWRTWDPGPRSGTLSGGDYREADVQYHLYVQWRCSGQMEELGAKARGLGLGLYLDLPLGVHEAGYDSWREREVFLPRCSLGAPPDTVFTGGQRWGISPLHPEGLRNRGHRYFIDCIRHNLTCAGALRIDHVMGLHRVYCIPEGMPASEGVYARYRPQELYAVLALESTRAQAMVVGEDLGTVPEVVRETMGRAGIRRMRVLEYDLEGAASDPFAGLSPAAVASVNTHDLPPFAGWWMGADIEDRVERGLLQEEEAADVHDRRSRARKLIRDRLSMEGREPPSTDEVSGVLAGVLGEYASSPAAIVLVNLEDLWLESEPQNVPGTGYERNNWRRRFRFPLETIGKTPEVLRLLQRIDEARRGIQ